MYTDGGKLVGKFYERIRKGRVPYKWLIVRTDEGTDRKE